MCIYIYIYIPSIYAITHESDLTRQFVIVTQTTSSCNNNNNNITFHIKTFSVYRNCNKTVGLDRHRRG